MESKSKVLGRSITVNLKDSAKTYNIIINFMRRGLAALKDETYHADRAEFVICGCCDSTFQVICSDIMAEGIELL